MSLLPLTTDLEKQWKKGASGLHQSILVLEGNGILIYQNVEIELKAGDSIYVPKEAGNYEVHGKVQFLLSEA